LQPLLANVHPEVVSKYYGCGIVVPAELGGLRVLDLGSGSGRDTYLLAQLVGASGEVLGSRSSSLLEGFGCVDPGANNLGMERVKPALTWLSDRVRSETLRRQ
jgi:hypothetical protein